MAAAPTKPSLCIVIADDEPDTVLTLAALLRQEGYDVIEASKGSEVLKHVAQHKPAAVILDIDMPGMSGYMVARELREVFREQAPLLVCISGKWIGQTDRMLADLAGFNHFLQKPCDPQLLLRLLEPLAVMRSALERSLDTTLSPVGK